MSRATAQSKISALARMVLGVGWRTSWASRLRVRRRADLHARRDRRVRRRIHARPNSCVRSNSNTKFARDARVGHLHAVPVKAMPASPWGRKGLQRLRGADARAGGASRRRHARGRGRPAAALESDGVEVEASTGCRTRRRPARLCQCSSATAAPAVAASVVESPVPDTCCGWLRGAQRSVTPGQSAVSSSESECSLEGGSCERSGFSEQPAEPLCVDFAPSAIFLSTHERPQQ
jgi:hypothetical protein